MSRTRLLIAAATALVLTAPAAQAVTFVAGGGNAEACYDYALNNQNTSDAIDVCGMALRGEPLSARDRAATHVNRGILHLRRGFMDDAMADFDAAIAVEPSLAEGYVNRGVAHLRQRNYAAAIDAISAGLERQPLNRAQALYNRGVAYEETGNVRAAYQDYRAAAEASPNWEAPRIELTRFQVR